MLKGFLPKEFAFFDQFDTHIGITLDICRAFNNLCLTNQDFEKYAEEIRKLEKEADVIIRVCTEALHKTFITPFDRTDIFTLIKRMDDIADFINSAVSRILLYEINSIRKEALMMSEILIKSVLELKEAIKLMRNMKEIELIQEKCKIVHELENEADDILKIAILNLFKENDAIMVIKWKEIFEKLEKSIDRCEGLASVIEGVVIDNA